ncbi:MAG: hypothetical protein RMM31_05865 [Anaerolineae bacterium]|nr:hypothetical protein [Anaerolineae bacterium]
MHNNSLDLRSGVAWVQTATLINKREEFVRQRANRYYLRFDRIDGELEVLRDLFDQAQVGAQYTVVYSPRVRRCWEVQPIAQS